jgi:hypothetical protein
MKVRVFSLLTLICFATTVNANGLTCPSSIKAGSKLTITANIKNNDCESPMQINRTLISYAGNSSGSSLGLQGPFVNSLARQIAIAPATDCWYDEWSGQGYGEGTSKSFTISSPTVIPATMAGTLIVAAAGVMDVNGKITVASACTISVTK